ncbi:MAG: hypothetical protein ACXVMS_18280 [Flavisolibacter sp.]
MDKDIEQIYIEFHNRAKGLFFSLFQDFQASTEEMNRHRQESDFRWKRELYVNKLQQQLQMIAREMLQQNRTNRQSELMSQNLNHFITDYIHQFIEKVKAL